MLESMTFTWPVAVPTLTDSELTLMPWAQAKSLPGIVDDLMTSCNDARMLEFTQVPTGYTADMAADYLADRSTVRWALVVENRYQGNIELRVSPEENRTVNVGYSAAPWGRGKGFMTRALKLVLEFSFTQNIYRFELRAAVQNSASRHVAESAGMTFEGVLRGAELLRGNVYDLAMYSKLVTD